VTDRAPETEADDGLSLYVSERELHRRLAPHMGVDAFKAAIRAAEREGFPR